MIKTTSDGKKNIEINPVDASNILRSTLRKLTVSPAKNGGKGKLFFFWKALSSGATC